MDFISRDALVTAMNAWVLTKDKPLGEILVEQKALAADRRTLLEALVQEHLKQHGNDAEKSLAAVSSLGLRAGRSAADRRSRTCRPRSCASPPPAAGRSACHAGPIGRQFHLARARASASFGPMPAAAWARSPWPATKNCTARSPSRRSRTGMPTTPTAAPASCWRPRSPAAWSIRASCRSTAWANMPTAGPTMPCASSAATASRRPSTAFTSSGEDQRLDSGERAVELRTLLGRFLDVCNAIAYAHSRGVLHRDLKPGNIMLGQVRRNPGRRLGAGQALRIQSETEVGVGGRADPAQLHGQRRRPTLMGSAIGTPQYMSPEQAAGRLDLLGPASDVYSLARRSTAS